MTSSKIITHTDTFDDKRHFLDWMGTSEPRTIQVDPQPTLAPRPTRHIPWLIALVVGVGLTMGLTVTSPVTLADNDQPHEDATVLARLQNHLLHVVPKKPDMHGPLAQLIQTAAKEHGLDPFFLLGLVQVESTYNPKAVSPKGALGLPQMMPFLVKYYGFTPEEFVSCTPCQIRLAAYHFTTLMKRYGGRHDLALLAYNGNLKPSQAHYVLKIHTVSQKVSLKELTPKLKAQQI